MKKLLLLSILLVALLAAGCSAPERTPRATQTPTPLPFPRIGAEGMLVNTVDSPIMFVAVDQEAYEEVFKALRIGDTLGTGMMILGGKIFIVQTGVKVLLLEVSTPFGQTTRWRVRVLEGDAIGRAGWVRKDWLAPISNQAVPPNPETSISTRTPAPTPTDTPTPMPTPVPTPSMPTEWEASVETPQARVLLLKTIHGAELKYWNVVVLIRNVGQEILRVERLLLSEVRECQIGPYLGALGMNASIVAEPWLDVDGTNYSLYDGTGTRVFSYGQDVWAKDIQDTYGYSFEIYPERWVTIAAGGNWLPERFGKCVDLSLKVGQEQVVFPLYRPQD